MTDQPPPPRDDAPIRTAPAESDRAISPIAGRFGGQRRWITLAALAAGCGVFLLATWNRGEPERPNPGAAEPPRQRTPFEAAQRDPDPPLLADSASDPNAPALGATTETMVPPLVPGPAAAGQGATAKPAPLMVYSRPALANAAASPSADLRGDLTPAMTGPATTRPLDALRQTGQIARAQAGSLPDRSLLLTAGGAVPCLLLTAMDSSTPGLVSCVIPKDVYSDNGAVVLLERGTRVLGEYQGGLQQGRERLFVLWTRAVTPSGVAIGLASPAADALGRAGFDGEIDTRFWPRFGGALLLSSVDDGVFAAAGRDGDKGGGARLPSDAAGIALQGSINIPPTLRKAQGAEVSILVAQDLDFGGVYRLRAR